MRVIPADVQHLLRSRAERCSPEIQLGTGHSRRAGAPEGALDVNGTGAGYGLRSPWGVGHAVRGLRLHSLAITAGAHSDYGSYCRSLPSICVNRVSAKKTETMCMPPPRTPRTMVRIEAAGQIYKQVQSFTYLGGSVTKTPDMSVEIARRTRACWMRIRRYLRELYDQPKVALSLKTRMVKAEAIEALLYGCSTWTLRQ